MFPPGHEIIPGLVAGVEIVIEIAVGDDDGIIMFCHTICPLYDFYLQLYIPSSLSLYMYTTHTRTHKQCIMSTKLTFCISIYAIKIVKFVSLRFSYVDERTSCACGRAHWV